MTPVDGPLALLLLLVAVEVVLVLTWVVETIAKRVRLDTSCPPRCRCHGARPPAGKGF